MRIIDEYALKYMHRVLFTNLIVWDSEGCFETYMMITRCTPMSLRELISPLALGTQSATHFFKVFENGKMRRMESHEKRKTQLSI